MATILEALQNANYNLDNAMKMQALLPIVKAQLNNAVTLLEKGYNLDDDIETVVQIYGLLEDVPDKDE